MKVIKFEVSFKSDGSVVSLVAKQAEVGGRWGEAAGGEICGGSEVSALHRGTLGKPIWVGLGWLVHRLGNRGGHPRA